MPKKKYVLKLSPEERETLEAVLRRGRCAGWKVRRAQVLLAIDASENGPNWTDARVAESYSCTSRSVEMWRKQAVLEGPLSLLERRPRTAPLGKFGADAHARLVALACSAPPDGRSRWTLRLLASRLVELEVVDSVSHETVRQELKKTISSRGES